jgi:hypothetical protein
MLYQLSYASTAQTEERYQKGTKIARTFVEDPRTLHPILPEMPCPTTHSTSLPRRRE